MAAGCQAELTPDALPCDLAAGNELKHHLPGAIRAFVQTKEQPEQRSIAKISRFAEVGPVTRQAETRAYIKAQDGCNNVCSYCTIPLARGRIRSRDEAEILKEAELLVQEGYKEVVLTGIHVCSYGRERGLDSSALARLVKKLDGIEGLERIRLSSLEPRSVTADFVRILASADAFCPHFHLSLQSGSDKILRAMRRRYDTADFRKAADYIRKSFPHVGLTTDVIVGFPGETEEDFRETMAFCEEMGFSRLHVFRYSSRPGTAAAAMKGQVDGKTAKARSEALIALGDRLAEAAMEKALGRETEILLEDKNEHGFRQGYTPDYLMCELRYPEKEALQTAEGDIVKVRLRAVDGERILAENKGLL